MTNPTTDYTSTIIPTWSSSHSVMLDLQNEQGFLFNYYFIDEIVGANSNESIITLPTQEHFLYSPDLFISNTEQINHTPTSMPFPLSSSPPSSPSSNSSTNSNKLSIAKRNTRIGLCEHPKHAFYRQPHHVFSDKQHSRQHPDCKHDTNASTPRRGRPPKGAKPIDRASIDIMTLQMNRRHMDENDGAYYQIAMTTRPLPKRLEAVVGRSNIHVCLTCLKKSDMDFEYLMNSAYIGPQRKVNSLSSMRN